MSAVTVLSEISATLVSIAALAGMLVKVLQKIDTILETVTGHDQKLIAFEDRLKKIETVLHEINNDVPPDQPQQS